MYGQVTPPIVKELVTLLGEKNVIWRDAETLHPYSHDESPGKSGKI